MLDDQHSSGSHDPGRLQQSSAVIEIPGGIEEHDTEALTAIAQPLERLPDVQFEDFPRAGGNPLHIGGQNAPGFDGVTVTPNGDIYVAALGQNGVARVAGGELTYIAGLFRGASDVDYSAAIDSLYVTNWNQTPLVIPGDQPQLPFALDIIDLSPEG